MREAPPKLNTGFNALSMAGGGKGTLPLTAQAYTPIAMNGQDDQTGKYFPDSVVEAAMDTARETLPQSYAAHTEQADFAQTQSPPPPITDRMFTLAESKALILDALNEFDPDLAERAADIFNNDDRWYLLEHVEPGQARLAQCRPANCEIDYAKNDKDHAVIEYQYDSTINGLIYLAHEVGHAIADDIQRENGHSHKTNPEHLQETQAYFVQHVIYDHLMNSDNVADDIRDVAKRHYTGTMAKEMYLLPVADNALGAEAAHETGEKHDMPGTIKKWFGDKWDKHELAGDIFETAQGLNSLPPGAPMPDALRDKLDTQVNRIHSRPMGLISSEMIVDRLQNADVQTRQDVRNSLFGKNGPQNIANVLAEAGISGQNELRAATRGVFENTAQGITGPAAPNTQPRPGTPVQRNTQGMNA